MTISLEELNKLLIQKETPEGAQLKANSAETAAKVYADNFIGVAIPAQIAIATDAATTAMTYANLANLAAQTHTDTAKTTLALLNADLAWSADKMALVTNDPTASNNGIYIKLGDIGVGSWQKSDYVPPVLDNSITTPKVVDKAITPSKLSFIPIIGVPSKNIFNKDDVGIIVGSAMWPDTGGPYNVNSDFNTSGFMPILPSTDYDSEQLLKVVCFFDDTQTYISGLSDVYNFTLPANTAYVRASYFAGDTNSLQIKPTSSVSGYDSFGTKINSDDLPKGSIDADVLSFLTPTIVPSKNLFNKATAIAEHYLYPDTGGIAPLVGYTTSAPIPVTVGNSYSCLLASVVVFYAANNSFVSSIINSPKSVTAPTGSAYMRFYTYNSYVDIMQVEKGVSTNYESYGNYISKLSLPKLGHNNCIIVDKDGTGDYTKIMDAVHRAGDSILNPVTILVMPGIYVESVDLRGKYISLIGVNKRTCIIIDKSGDYYSPPINLGSNFYIANLTVISTHEEDIGYVLPSYGIHIDALGEGVGEINNCIVMSKQNNAIGCGLHNNQTLIINNCELYKQDTDRPTDVGALRVHNDQQNGSINQKLIVKNTRMESDTGIALALQDANNFTGGGFGDARDTEFSFYNNIVWSNELGKTNVLGVTPVLAAGCIAGYIKLTEDSFGNNIPDINA